MISWSSKLENRQGLLYSTMNGPIKQTRLALHACKIRAGNQLHQNPQKPAYKQPDRCWMWRELSWLIIKTEGIVSLDIDAYCKCFY